LAQNTEMAVDRPTHEQDTLAGLLIETLVAIPRTVAIRHALLAECLDAL
jgi:CBS domain containing-hemolysin-like protein